MRRFGLAGLGLTVFVAGLAVGAEGTPAGGSGSAHVKGEGDGYRIATPKAPVTLQAKGAGDLTLKIRGVLPAGAIPSDGAKVRILDNGTELAHLSLSIYASGAFSDRADVVPSGSSSRSFHLADGNHAVTVETKGGNAAVSLHWKGKHTHGGHHAAVAAAVDTTAPTDLSATPLSEEPPAAPLAVPPPAVASASPPATGPMVVPKPAPIAEIAAGPAPQPVPAEALSPVVSTSVAPPPDTGRSPLPFILLGGAALCAAGSGVSIGLAVGQDGSYNSTPENQGMTATNRNGMLNTANAEVAAGEILGAAAAAFLIATGVSLLF